MLIFQYLEKQLQLLQPFLGGRFRLGVYQLNDLDNKAVKAVLLHLRPVFAGQRLQAACLFGKIILVDKALHVCAGQQREAVIDKAAQLDDDHVPRCLLEFPYQFFSFGYL